MLRNYHNCNFYCAPAMLQHGKRFTEAYYYGEVAMNYLSEKYDSDVPLR